MQAETLLREGRLDEALADLQGQVRAKPADAGLRVFLFQTLALMGQWDRALTQLNVAADLDPATLLMAQVCRPAIASEALRAEIFAGRRLPVVIGEPAEWTGLLLRAAQLAGEGRFDQAATLRDRAFEQAPAIPGSIDLGQGPTMFEWIADADPRLGPMLEVIVEGRYSWVPLAHIRELAIEPPTDLRDLVWAPAAITWTNGGHSVALLPARYPGSESSPDPTIRLGRRTEWTEQPGGYFTGLGQRMLATDQGEHPLLEVRRVVLGSPPDGEGSGHG